MHNRHASELRKRIIISYTHQQRSRRQNKNFLELKIFSREVKANTKQKVYYIKIHKNQNKELRQIILF